MDALRVGFVVISAPRLYAAVALALLLVVAEVGAWAARRRGQQADGGWAWNALFAVVVGARLGFVLENFEYYRGAPLQELAFWQGGFSPWWGVAAGRLAAAWTLRRNRAALGAMVPAAVVALGAWLGE